MIRYYSCVDICYKQWTGTEWDIITDQEIRIITNQRIREGGENARTTRARGKGTRH